MKRSQARVNFFRTTLLALPLLTGLAAFAMGGFRATMMAKAHLCGPIKMVQSLPGLVNWAGAVASSTSLPITETAGNLLVAVVTVGDGTNSVPPNEVITVADSGNTFYPGPIYTSAINGNKTAVQIFYAANIFGGANTVTASVSGNGFPTTTIALYLTEYSGIATTNVVDISSGQAAPSASQEITPGNMTISTACDLVVGTYSDGGQGGQTGGYAAPDWLMLGQSTYTAGALVDNSNSGAKLNSVVNATMYTYGTASTTWVAAQMAFRASNTSALPQPTKIAFTSTPPAQSTWSCAAMTVQSQNASSQPTNTATGITVGLSASNTVFYADANCVYPITSTLIGAGANSQTFYFSSSVQGSPVITASATGFTSINQTESVNSNNAFTWIGSLGGASCTSALHWTTGACWQGGVAPSSTQTAIFDTTCTASCNPSINADVTVGGIVMAPSTLTTLNEGAFNITVGAEGFIFNGGTFNGSATTTVTLKVNGTLTISAGNFTSPVGSGTKTSMTVQGFVQSGGTFTGSATTAATTKINGPFSLSGGTFTAPAGTLGGKISAWLISGSPTITIPSNSNLVLGGTLYTSVVPGTSTYQNVTFAGNAAWIDLNGGTMTVAGNLTVGDSTGGNGFYLENGTINVSGASVTAVNQGYGGSATIVLTGNAAGQTINGNGIQLPHVTIAAGTNNVTLNGNVMVTGYTLTSVGTLNVAGSTLSYVCQSYDPGCPISPGESTVSTSTFSPGAVPYNNVYIYARTTTIDLGGQTMTVLGNFSEGADWSYYFLENGTINVSGDVTGINAGFGGSAVINLTGNPSGQTIYGNGAEFPHVRIAAGANNVTLNGSILVSGYTLTSVGTLATAGSTLTYACIWGDTCQGATPEFSPSSISYNNLGVLGLDNNFDLGGATWHVNGNFTLGDQHNGGFVVNNGTIIVGGDVTAAYRVDTATGVGYGGNANIVLAGNAAGQTIYGNDFQLPNVTISTGANPVTLNGIVNVTGFAMTSVGTFNVGGSTLAYNCQIWDTSCPSATGVFSLGSTVAYNNVAIQGNLNNFDLGGASVQVGGNLTLGDSFSGSLINNGKFLVAGGFNGNNCGYKGSVQMSFVGSAAQTMAVTASGCGSPALPAGNITVNATGGGTLGLQSNIIYTGAGQQFAITAGAVNMNGNALTIPGQLTIGAGTTLTKSGGTLTDGSLVNNGTLNP